MVRVSRSLDEENIDSVPDRHGWISYSVWWEFSSGCPRMLIDTSFDFRTDASGGDPDESSPTLRQYHKLLWSKTLPSGRLFDLDDSVPGVYLHHRSELGEFLLSSDSVIATFTRRKRASVRRIIKLFTEEENEAFRAKRGKDNPRKCSTYVSIV